MKTIYKKLQKKLDQLSTGYPETQSGIELKILEQLFSENEAALFLSLTPFLESSDKIAARLNQDDKKISNRLENMAKKGLIFRLRKSKSASYAVVPFVPGIFEFQVNHLNPNISKDIQQYYEEGFSKSIMAFKHPPMRTIPVDKALVSEWPIAPYEDVERIFDMQDRIALLNCVCRTWGRQVDNGCDKPLETCFYFGSHGDYFIENQAARYVDAQEAKKIVKETLSQHGLVLQLSAGKKPVAVCMCCGDCCNMLLSLKSQPFPAKAAKSNYFIVAKKEECIGCEECLQRCQMDAIQVKDDTVVVDYNRCIGCGACTFACSNEALLLQKKPEEALYVPPSNMTEFYLEVASQRGLL